MATLVGNVNSSATSWTVSTAIPSEIDYLAIDSETVEVLTHTPSQLDPQTRAPLPAKISVRRAAGGTTAASHTSGATLTPVIPPAASGGAGSDVPDPATGDEGDAVQVSAGAYVLGPTVQVIYASEDPGAVGAGNIWLRIDGSRRALFVRNEADDGWITPQITVYETDDEGSPFISRLAVAANAGNGEADLIAGNPDLTTYGSLSLSVAGTILSFTDGNDALQITLGDSFGTTGVHIVMGDGVTEAKLRVTAAGVEMEGLPTVNPGVGNKVWNDGGTLKITAAA